MIMICKFKLLVWLRDVTEFQYISLRDGLVICIYRIINYETNVCMVYTNV